MNCICTTGGFLIVQMICCRIIPSSTSSATKILFCLQNADFLTAWEHAAHVMNVWADLHGSWGGPWLTLESPKAFPLSPVSKLMRLGQISCTTCSPGAQCELKPGWISVRLFLTEPYRTVDKSMRCHRNSKTWIWAAVDSLLRGKQGRYSGFSFQHKRLRAQWRTFGHKAPGCTGLGTWESRLGVNANEAGVCSQKWRLVRGKRGGKRVQEWQLHWSHTNVTKQILWKLKALKLGISG